KFVLYEANGAKEYWIVDAANRFIDVYTHRDDTLTLLGTFDEEHDFQSPQLQITHLYSDLFATV
ncbi:MAG: Uma2 family endonuclease, partial [Chloroflexota bacterium]